MIRAGLIGCGVIGGALKDLCDQKGIELPTYDKFKPGMTDFEPILKTDLVFVCVPTPTIEGSQDLSALRETLERLTKNSYRGAVVIRSTVLPGTTDNFSCTFPLMLAHNPEFLTAAKPRWDLVNQGTVLIGSKYRAALDLVELWWRMFDPFVQVKTADTPKATEMAKYIHNCGLANKVSFSNEMYELCQNVHVSFDEAMALAVSMGGIGKGHTKVPGPDGALGYGGMCFPKDTLALLKFMQKQGMRAEILKASVEQNVRVRPQAYNGIDKDGVCLR